MKILVVEDDAAVRKFITTLLKKENYTVYDADNGMKALVVLKEQKDITLLITDLIMPEMEGFETIKEVKKQYPSINIIAISGGGQVGPENFLVLADALGAHTTLKKPFSGQELIRAIKNL
jgi:DNA-binding response OmpR family regulator